MNLVRLEAFAADYNRFIFMGRFLQYKVRNFLTMSYSNTLNNISLDAVFHAASNEDLFKLLR